MGMVSFIGSKEFYDLLENFEKNSGFLPYVISFEKEDHELWKEGHVYQDGKTNNYFQCFLLGYQFGRANYLQG